MNITDEGLESHGRYYSQYKGTVANNADPLAYGRLQLIVPQIYGQEAYKYWAPPMGMPIGGSGIYMIPDVGDNVWVLFENGDPRYPVWQYGIADNAPLTTDGSKAPTGLKLVYTAKHRIELDDTNNKVRIIDGNGNHVVLNSTGVSIVSAKVSLGSLDGSAEKAILGDTLKGLLTDLLTAVKAITVGTAFGPSGTPLNLASFVALEARLDTILSTKTTLN